MPFASLSRVSTTPYLRAGALLASVAVLLAAGPATAQTVEPASVRKLVADGKHNAFTALAKFKDAYYLAFRSATDHNSQDGEIVVLRSTDGEDWRELRRFNFVPDDRDPQILVMPGQMILYAPSMDGGKLTTFAVTTEDGESFSEPRTVYEPQFIFWKPLAVKDGYLATAHRKTDGRADREAHLIRSSDGLNWVKVSTIRAGRGESESTLLAAPDGKLTAFVRTKGDIPGHILESSPPYQEWAERPAGIHLSGHAVREFAGVTYLFSRTFDATGQKMGTAIYTYADGRPKLYCTLPSGGDCSYPEAVQIGEEMLVSFYSSHEGSTNIYLARVPLLCEPRGLSPR